MHMSGLIEAGYILAILVTGIGAILAWVAKLRWSKEYAEAKDQTIRTKDANIEQLKSNHELVMKAKDAHIEQLKSQVSGLQELNPSKLREHYLASTSMLEQRIDDLKKQLEQTESENARL